MTKRDYYEVLGVARDASDSDLKKAFRTLARRNHPDKNPDDPEAETRFKEIQEAYAVLSNKDQRKNYDMFGHDSPRGSPFGPSGFQGVDISFEDLFNGGGFESIFSSFFGGGNSGRRRRQTGDDRLIRHRIDMETVMLGGESEVEATIFAECEVCDGSGAESPSGVQTCSTCDGQGRIAQNVRRGPFIQQMISDCHECNGRGRRIINPCKSCRGEGREEKVQTIRFNIPAGISSGTRLRMGSRGDAIRGGGGRPGDLYIQIDVKPHEWFERDGSDLLMALPIGYPELLLGTTVTLPHLDGKDMVIEVPPASMPGETLAILGRGLPRRGGRGRGDVTVLMKLHVPAKVSKAAKAVIEGIRDEIGVDEDGIIDLVKEEAARRRSE